jgi:hypothetical protein
VNVRKSSEPLTELQARRLAERGYRWITTIRRLNAAIAAVFDDLEGSTAETIDNIHMLAVALQHLDTCVRLLQRGRKLPGAREFRRQWASVSVLRDALEHEEEYVAGRGRNRDERVGEQWTSLQMFETHLMLWSEEGIESLGFMGRRYVIRPAIVAALDLEEAMFGIWNPPIEVN